MNSLLEQKITYLSGFMTEERLGVLQRAVDLRTRYMTVVLENIYHPQNASAVIRTCEAFGLQDVHAVEQLVRFSPNVNIVRGTDKWIELHKYRDTPNPSREAIDKLRADGYRIVATSPHIDDRTPEEFDVTRGKFALVFGTEHAGISPEVIESADEFVKIPMQGMVESLNISVCAAILIRQFSHQIRTRVADWQLPQEERREILFRWMTASVKDSKNIMKRFTQE